MYHVIKEWSESGRSSQNSSGVTIWVQKIGLRNLIGRPQVTESKNSLIVFHRVSWKTWYWVSDFMLEFHQVDEEVGSAPAIGDLKVRSEILILMGRRHGQVSQPYLMNSDKVGLGNLILTVCFSPYTRRQGVVNRSGVHIGRSDQDSQDGSAAVNRSSPESKFSWTEVLLIGWETPIQSGSRDTAIKPNTIYTCLIFKKKFPHNQPTHQTMNETAFWNWLNHDVEAGHVRYPRDWKMEARSRLYRCNTASERF